MEKGARRPVTRPLLSFTDLLCPWHWIGIVNRLLDAISVSEGGAAVTDDLERDVAAEAIEMLREYGPIKFIVTVEVAPEVKDDH